MRLRLLVATALLSPSWAQAADWTSLTTRFLSDPAYLPLAGNVNGELSYGYSVETSDLLQENPRSPFVPVGTETQHNDRDSNNFGGDLHYGITDDISVGVTLNTGNERDQETYLETVLVRPVCPQLAVLKPTKTLISLGPIPGCGQAEPPTVKNLTETQDFRFIGMSNPDFNLAWRAVSEAWAPINVDLAVNYRPSLFANRDATPNGAGTLAGGSQHFGFTTNISRETELLTVAIYGTVGYTDRQSMKNPYDEVDGGHFGYTAGVQTQTRLTPRLSLNLGSGVGWSYRYSTYDNGYLDHSIRPGVNYTPYAALVVRVIPTRLNCVLRYEHDIFGDRLTSNKFEPQSLVTQDEANSFTMTLSYRF